MCACRLLTVFSAIGLSLAFSLETTEVTVAVFMLRICGGKMRGENQTWFGFLRGSCQLLSSIGPVLRS